MWPRTGHIHSRQRERVKPTINSTGCQSEVAILHADSQFDSTIRHAGSSRLNTRAQWAVNCVGWLHSASRVSRARAMQITRCGVGPVHNSELYMAQRGPQGFTPDWRQSGECMVLTLTFNGPGPPRSLGSAGTAQCLRRGIPDWVPSPSYENGKCAFLATHVNDPEAAENPKRKMANNYPLILPRHVGKFPLRPTDFT